MIKIKDYLIPFAVALFVTFAIKYFFMEKNNIKEDEKISNKSFTAPSSKQIAEPLYFDVNFCNTENTESKEILTKIETDYGTLTFSNFGAVLSRSSYNLKNNSDQNSQNTIDIIKPENSKENGAFLLVLSGVNNTPYYYNLEEYKKEDNFYKLTYKAQDKEITILKEFFVDLNKPEINLNLTLEPNLLFSDREVRARIFLPGPFSETLKEDFNKAIVCSENNKIEKKFLKDLKLFGKENPSLFGLEDKYFANLLIKDKDDFSKRAYFKIEENRRATSVFESSFIKEKTVWHLSFYSGPKQLDYLAQTDSRLPELLEYGWFGIFAKPILYLLNFIYSIVKSYGLSIIILTIISRLIILPFTFKSEYYRKRNLEMQKKLKYLEQTYKDDPEILAREKLELIKKYGTGLGLPLITFIQLPIFIGLSRVINNAIELYKTGFLWIKDLSSPDQYYILPIIFGISLSIQMAQASSTTKQKLIVILMAIVFAAFSSNFSAGLNLYVSFGTVFAILQTYLQRKFKI